MTAYHLSRRRFLRTTTALSVIGVSAGCTPVAPGTTPPPASPASPATLSAEATLFANAIAALEPYIPSASVVLQQVQADAKQAAALASQIATVSTSTAAGMGSTILGLVTTLAPLVIGLFPGGGTAVTLINAALGLAPEFQVLLGLLGARAAVVVPAGAAPLPVPIARSILAALPPSRYLTQ